MGGRFKNNSASGKIIKIIILSILIFLSLLTFNALPGFSQTEIQKIFFSGLEKENNGDYLSAIFIYREILEKNRYFLDAKIALARCYYKTGNLSESEILLKEALDQDSKNLSVLNLLGRVYIALRNYKNAEDVFNNALNQDPANIETRYGIADLYRVRGDYKKAVEIYQDILKIYPQDVWAYIHLGTSYTKMGELDKAGGFFRKAVSLDSQSPWTHINLARHYYNMGIYYSEIDTSSSESFFDASLYEARTALKIQKGLPQPFRIEAAVQFFRKNYNSSIEADLTLIELGEKDYTIPYQIGYCYEMVAELQKAEEFYFKALRARIDDEISRFRLEEAVLQLYRENLSNSKRVELADYHAEKAEYYLEHYAMEMAFYHYKRAVQLNPINPDFRLKLAELYRMKDLYELYLHELRDIIRDTLDVDTVDINDRIEIYEAHVQKNLSSRWNVNQYIEDSSSPGYVPRTKVRVAVLNGFFTDYLKEDFIHRGFSKSFSQMLSSVLSLNSRLEVITGKNEVKNEKEALKQALDLNVDYYLTGKVKETHDSLSVEVSLHSGINGRLLNQFKTYFTGNDRVYNSVFSISSRINEALPLHGLIVRLRGNRALINLGFSHGVKEDMVFNILRKGGLKKDPQTGEFLINPEVILGKLTIAETDETVSEGTYTFTGIYNRINVYDHIILAQEEKPEEKKEAGA